MQNARVAILLVSQNFVDSDFIHKHELPPLLDAAKKRGLTILRLALRHCDYENTPLASYQAVNDPGRPLNSLPEHEVDFALKNLNHRIREIAQIQFPTTSLGQRIFLVPYERNSAFAGRQEELQKLDRDLLRGAGALSQTAGIFGLGGVGKTQTAVECVYRHRDRFTAAFGSLPQVTKPLHRATPTSHVC